MRAKETVYCGHVWGSSRGTVWSHLFDSNGYSRIIMWAVTGMAKPQFPGTVRVAVGRARVVVLLLSLLWTSCQEQPSGWKLGPTV